jgi:hypothetical protein
MYIVVDSVHNTILHTSAYSKYHYLQLRIHITRIYNITVHEIEFVSSFNAVVGCHSHTCVLSYDSGMLNSN